MNGTKLPQLSFQNTLISKADKGLFPNKSTKRYSAVGVYCTLGLYSEPVVKPTSKSVSTDVMLELLPTLKNLLSEPNTLGTAVNSGTTGSKLVVNTRDCTGFHNGVVAYS